MNRFSFSVLAICLAALCGYVASPASAQEPEAPSTIIMAFQPQENTMDLAPNAEKLAAWLTERVGVEVKVYLPTSYSAVVEAMRAGQADVAYFDSRPFTVAQSLADAEALVAELRDGKTWYWSQWFVRKDSGIDTLEQLRGKSVAFTSPLSTSGYIMPFARLVKEGWVSKGGSPDEFFRAHIFAGGYEQALLAMYNKQVDTACVSAYAFERYLTDEQRAEVKLLDQQGPVPTHVIAVRRSLPPELKEKLRASFLALNEPENEELAKSVYGAKKFVQVGEDHAQFLKEAIEITGIDPIPGEQPAKPATN